MERLIHTDIYVIVSVRKIVNERERERERERETLIEC